MWSGEFSGAKHATTGLQSSGDAFFGVMNNTFPSGIWWLSWGLEFAGRMVHFRGGITQQGCFRSRAWPLPFSEKKFECLKTPRHFGQFHAPNLSKWPSPWRHGWQSLVWMNMTALHSIVLTWTRSNTFGIRAETESQALSTNISVWPQQCTFGGMVKYSHQHTPKPCGQPSQKSQSLI